MRYSRSEYAVRQDAVVLLAVQTMNYLYEGHHRLVR
jgi:pantothenate synthetase